MTAIEFNENKSWYMSAVESCLILRGMTKQEALNLIAKYRLEERIDTYPEIQLHYDVEVTADEIVSGQ